MITFQIAKRELLFYFRTPAAYVFTICYLLISSISFFYLGNFFERNQADLKPFFTFQPWILMVFVPAIGMPLWSREIKSRHIEILHSLPVSMERFVIAKYLGAFSFILFNISLTFPLAVTVNYLGSPDNGIIFTSYLGTVLLGASYLAITCWASSLSGDQVVSFTIAVILCSVFNLIGWGVVVDLFRGIFTDGIALGISELSFSTKFNRFQEGIVELRDLVYLLIAAVAFLWMAVFSIQARRGARQLDET